MNTTTTLDNASTPEEAEAQMRKLVAAHRTPFLIEGAVLMVLGVLAFTMPLLGTLAVDIFLGWLFITGGFVRVVTLLTAKHRPGYWWSMLAGVAAIVLGAALVISPLQGILTLTVAMMVIFGIEGIASIGAAMNYRERSRNWLWLLINGLVDFALVFLLIQGWPGTAAWALGVLAGIDLFFLGLSLTMVALSARRSDSPA